jgi:hypothetical protein
MTTMTPNPVRRAAPPIGLALGSVAGTALLAAGIWNALIQGHVTVPAAPSGIGPPVPPLQAMHAYYTWYAGTVGQQRADTVVAMIGVSGLALLADALRRRADADLVTRAACTAIGTGSIVWLIGALIGIGGHRAVGLMAIHGNPVAGVNSIAFTVDVTADAFSAAAFILLGLAMVGIGVTPVPAGSRRWTTLSTVTGLVSLVVAIGYLQGVDSVTTYVLGALAAVLLPAWLVWTGHILDSVDS